MMNLSQISKKLAQLERLVKCAVCNSSSAANCTDFLPLLDSNSAPITSYPTAVYGADSSLIGVANDKNEYVSLWNSYAPNQEVGTISATAQDFTFRIQYTTEACASQDAILSGGEAINYPLMNFNNTIVPEAPYGLFNSNETFIQFASGAEDVVTYWNSTPSLFNVAEAVQIPGDDTSINLIIKTPDPIPDIKALRYWQVQDVNGGGVLMVSANTYIRRPNATLVKSQTVGVLGTYNDFEMNYNSYGGYAIPFVDTTSQYYKVTLTTGMNTIFHSETGEWAWLDVFGVWANNSGNLPPTIRHLAIQSLIQDLFVRNLRVSNFSNYTSALFSVESIAFNGAAIPYDTAWAALMPNLKYFQMIDTAGLNPVRQIAELGLTKTATPNVQWITFRRNNPNVNLVTPLAVWQNMPNIFRGCDFAGADIAPAAEVDNAFIGLSTAITSNATGSGPLVIQDQNATRTAASNAAVAILQGKGYTIL